MMKPTKVLKDNRGVTLVELICAIAIFGMVVAAAVSMIVFASRTNADVSVDTIQNLKVTTAFDLIKEQVRESESVEFTYKDEKLNKFAVSETAFYEFREDKLIYVIGSSETVLIEGIKNIDDRLMEIPSLDGDKKFVGNYISLKFEFENGDVRQLSACCRGIVDNNANNNT